MHPKLFVWNCSKLYYWQARRDSNPQPTALEAAILPIELLACSVAGAEAPLKLSALLECRLREPVERQCEK